jgi:serine/threonine-protein kinase
MPLEAGKQFGMYQILSPLGSGGMGDVYRARDTKLNRDVALKVIPDFFERDHERLARFTREAQVLASLNHPNIAAIYGVEEISGRSALVLELVDGETLAERIAKGPIAIEEALTIALQIAEALETAHEKSIVHRDLKPANVKITSQGTVKVLDFGLAKALEDEPSGLPNLSQSPTLSVAATGAGIILGTAGYMAPEQARGKPADRRADIWAFGAVVFEMLTARRVFDGETVSDTLAKVLEREPDWRQLPPRTPAALRKLLQRCLTKNVKDRLQAIGDARTSIQELIADPANLQDELEVAPYPLWKRVLPWAVAPLLLVAGWLLKPSAVPRENGISRFEYVLPNDQNLVHRFRHAVALSSDGKRMAFVGRTGVPGNEVGFVTDSTQRIYLKSLDQWDANAVQGTEDSVNPFFSPNGQWLGFVQQSDSRHFTIKKVELSGGSPVRLADTMLAPIGITWGTDGTIVFAPNVVGGLKRIRDTGGDADDFTTLNTDAQEVSHRLPHFLPDGSGVLFTVLRYEYNSPDWKRAQVWVKSLKSGERKLLLEDATDGQFVKGGYLVFAREGRLLAVRFDAATFAIQGSPIPVVDGVTHSTHNTTINTWTGAAQYSVSENGSLIYAPGSIEPPSPLSLVWIDRNGITSPLPAKPSALAGVRLSPDARRIAFVETHLAPDVRILDTARGPVERQTTDGQSRSLAIWSPDGTRIAFASSRSGPRHLYLKTVDSPEEIPLTQSLSPSSWSPDGKEIAFVLGDPETGSAGYDISVVSVNPPHTVRPVLNTRFNETHPEFSPNGQWLSYCSDESGRREVYVQPYPGPGRRVPISTDGGCDHGWSRDGNEIFFRGDFGSSQRRMMSVRVKVSGGELVPERPVALFDAELFRSGAIVRFWDISADGRFLITTPGPEDPAERMKKIFPSTLRVVLNWTDELQRFFENN